MAIWPQEAINKLEEAQRLFSEHLRKFSEDVSGLDGSHIVTDANIEEARKLLMRGDRKKRHPWIAVLRALLELIGGGFVGAAIPLCLEKEPQRVLIGAFLVAGILMFVTAKVIEHLTEL
ncbi:MAG: hypothetical protein KGL39_52160 [Patescibacteria group bacterium]|nr:hypothetical protein [Patescibacteria group bacterium]